jgi:Mg2+ transporter MgtE
VTSLAFQGPDKTPFMLSWRKFVGEFDGDSVRLNVAAPDIRFSYLQPDEVLLARDLMSKQIVDTQGMKVVRVNDLKLSESRNQLRLLGAEVGARGILRGIHPALERTVAGASKLLGRELAENIIAWNYMDLLDRDLSQVKLSVTHKRLHELHPADVADILEKLAPAQRARVFDHLNNEQAADTISELDDELQADVIDDLSERRASALLAEMDPDDAADIVADLPYDKAEALLRLMGVKESSAIRSLLGYKEKTAGGIMTPEVTTVTEDMTVEQVINQLRAESGEHESIYYVYVVEGDKRLAGVISLRDLLLAAPDVTIESIAKRDLFVAHVDDDQEDVAEQMAKYDLLALPVTDETGKLLGIVTVDDALDVLEEESAEDLALATGRPDSRVAEIGSWLGGATGWITAWVVAGLIGGGALAYFRSWDSTFVVAVLFVPLVMRVSDQIATHSLGLLIDPRDEGRKRTLARLGVDLAAGVSLGAISGLIALALLQSLKTPVVSALLIALSIALSVLTLVLAGASLPFVLRRKDGTWRASANFSSALMSVGGVSLYLALAVLLLSKVGK